MNCSSPYLSIVVAARNDDYGGDFLQRLHLFARNLVSIGRRFPQLFELIVVEWNPPPRRPTLETVLDWRAIPRVRIITVPPEVHRTLQNPLNMPMFEFHAKNVGIRRAHGKFVLTTNADVVFDPSVFNFLARKNLSQRLFYRLDRYDVRFDRSTFDVNEFTHDKLMRGVTRIHIRHGFGSFGPISFDIAQDTPVEQWPQSDIFPEDEVVERNMVICYDRRNYMWGLHTNASGDFILAGRNAWFDVGGFWERTDTFAHLDSYLLCQLSAKGYWQVLLRRPYLILHAEHSREEQKRRLAIDWDAAYSELQRVMNREIVVSSKQKKWGFADQDFSETIFA
jgi:hypothetical protein